MPIILQSIQVGRVQRLGRDNVSSPHDDLWTTGFLKTPVAGAVRLDSQGVAGDEQADRVNHGGPDKAVLLYSANHYAAWSSELGEPEIHAGGFGENLTVAGLDENGVCLGDRWRCGGAVLEVSQPRQPCWKLGRRWRRPELPRLVVQTGRTGWYCRVVAEGSVLAPAPLELLSRPQPEWTIARANRVFYSRRENAAAVIELSAVPELSLAWREQLRTGT